MFSNVLSVSSRYTHISQSKGKTHEEFGADRKGPADVLPLILCARVEVMNAHYQDEVASDGTPIDINEQRRYRQTRNDLRSVAG